MSDAELKFVGLPEVRKMVANAEENPKAVLFIDPRPARAFAAGHIPGARNYELSRFKGIKGDTEPEIDRFKAIVVYGDDPATGSARGMAKRLMTTGYDPVYLFSGGLQEWERAGLPVDRDPAAAETSESTAGSGSATDGPKQ